MASPSTTYHPRQPAADVLHRVRLELRRPWADGTTHLLFDPVELLERLALLTPRPRINLILYDGVLAPRAAWRSLVVEFGANPGAAAETDPAADRPASPHVADGDGVRSPALTASGFGTDD